MCCSSRVSIVEDLTFFILLERFLHVEKDVSPFVEDGRSPSFISLTSGVCQPFISRTVAPLPPVVSLQILPPNSVHCVKYPLMSSLACIVVLVHTVGPYRPNTHSICTEIVHTTTHQTTLQQQIYKDNFFIITYFAGLAYLMNNILYTHYTVYTYIIILYTFYVIFWLCPEE